MVDTLCCALRGWHKYPVCEVIPKATAIDMHDYIGKGGCGRGRGAERGALNRNHQQSTWQLLGGTIVVKEMHTQVVGWATLTTLSGRPYDTSAPFLSSSTSTRPFVFALFLSPCIMLLRLTTPPNFPFSIQPCNFRHFVLALLFSLYFRLAERDTQRSEEERI